MSHFEPLGIPGVLQTEEYAGVLIRTVNIRLRGRPSRGYLVERGEPGRPYSNRWYLTDTGRAHLVEHLDTYRQIYPDVDVTGLEEFTETSARLAGD